MKLVCSSLAALTACSLSTGAALAAPRACEEGAPPQWISAATVLQKAESLGYAVQETKRRKNCWKLEGTDRNGAKIEIYLDGASGEVVRASEHGSIPDR